MDVNALELEIARCEREANEAKKRGDFDSTFLKLDLARRLRERLEKSTQQAAGSGA